MAMSPYDRAIRYDAATAGARRGGDGNGDGDGDGGSGEEPRIVYETTIRNPRARDASRRRGQ
jgi:hypothetical protein